MGLIHSRASKKRDKAQAKLLNAQRKQLKAQGNRRPVQAQPANPAGQQGAVSDNPLRQPTLGGAISTWQRNRQQR
jgi:hypothetical protein